MKLSIKLGILFPVILGLIVILSIITNINFLDQLSLFLLVVPLMPFVLLFNALFGNPLIITGHDFVPFPNIAGFIIVFLIYILIGLFIGWIIGKIKSKK